MVMGGKFLNMPMQPFEKRNCNVELIRADMLDTATNGNMVQIIV